MVHTCVWSVYQNKYISNIRANKKFMLQPGKGIYTGVDEAPRWRYSQRKEPRRRSLPCAAMHFGMFPPPHPASPTSFTHKKARGKCYDELKLYILIHEACGRGKFLIVTPASQEWEGKCVLERIFLNIMWTRVGVGICFFNNSQIWVFENKKFKELSWFGSFILRRFKELPRFGF